MSSPDVNVYFLISFPETAFNASWTSAVKMQRRVSCRLLERFSFLFYSVSSVFFMDVSKQKRVRIKEMSCDIFFHICNVQFVRKVD